MKRSESKFASEKMALMRSKYRVQVVADWGFENRRSGAWRQGTWSKMELDKLGRAIALLADAMGGAKKFTKNLDSVTVRKLEMGSHGGEALIHEVRLSSTGTFSAWTVIHEMAHAWDAKEDWKLSLALERTTGGYTSKFFSLIRKLFGRADCALWNYEEKSGRRGRLPGCNLAGYFYGDCPSGSNWHFNRKEDFAESVAMYVGWKNNNELTEWADARIERYRRENGTNIKYFGVDNWADYAPYFYPPHGDYTQTKRWKFVDDLVHARVRVD